MTIQNFSERLHSLGVLYVDVYPWRKAKDGQIEFLILKRKDQVELNSTWQAISGKLIKNEKISDAFWRLVYKRTGLEAVSIFKIDYVNVFYDAYYDTVMHVPVAAAELKYLSEVKLSDLHVDFAWVKLDDALNKLIWPNQQLSLRLMHDMILESKISKFHYLERLT